MSKSFYPKEAAKYGICITTGLWNKRARRRTPTSFYPKEAAKDGIRITTGLWNKRARRRTPTKFLSEGGRKRWVLYYDGLVKQKGSKEDADNFLSERAALNGAKGWPAYHKKLLESLSSEEEVKKFLSEKNRKQRDLYYDGLVEQKGSKEDADKFLSEGANACLAAQKKRKRENGKLDIALWTIQRPSKETEPLSFTYIGTFFYINEAQRYLSTTSNKQIWMEKQSVNAWNAANANPSSEHYFFNSGLEYVCKAVTENMLCSNAGHPQLQRTEYNDLRPKAKGLQAYIPMPSLDQMIKDGVNHVAVWIIRKPAKDDEPLSFDFQGIFTSPYEARNHLFPGDVFKTKGRTTLVKHFKMCRTKPTTYVRFIFLEIEYVLQVTHADATAVNLKQPRGYMAAPNI
ncbi:hypothetical protein M885DRAFT_7283 [Pelagophyceae sp. CCMP2097]|nr:hypothetical protein M885DRAFT_7283 [Pelagophyceae sp. CCMP2097]